MSLCVHLPLFKRIPLVSFRTQLCELQSISIIVNLPLVEIKEKSFKPYIKTEEGMIRPSNGHRYCWSSKGFYPMEDRMTEWKHDVPVGTMKMVMLLENRISMVYHPDGEVAKDLKRKWDDLNKVNV